VVIESKAIAFLTITKEFRGQKKWKIIFSTQSRSLANGPRSTGGIWNGASETLKGKAKRFLMITTEVAVKVSKAMASITIITEFNFKEAENE